MFPVIAFAAVATAISHYAGQKRHRHEVRQQTAAQNEYTDRQYDYDKKRHQFDIDRNRRDTIRSVDNYNAGVDFYNKKEEISTKFQREQADIQNEYLSWQAKEIDERNRAQVRILELQNAFSTRSKNAEETLSKLSAAKTIAKVTKTAFDLKDSYDNIFATGDRTGFKLSKGNSQDLAVGNLVRSGMLSTAMSLLEAIEAKKTSDIKIASLEEKSRISKISKDSYFDSEGNMKSQKFAKVNYIEPVYRERMAYPDTGPDAPEPIRGANYTASGGSSLASGLQLGGTLASIGAQVAGMG